jgi:iron-sulfur cluster repair protein YtfE (RIC family)
MPTKLKKETVARVRTSRRRGPGVFEMLRECHEDIRKYLDVLEDVGTALLSAGHFSRRHLAGLCETLAFLDVVLTLHSEDEEDTLFPELCQLDPVGAKLHLALESLREDHRNHGVLELRLKIAVLQHDARTAGRLAQEIAMEYREHLRQEEETLFPWAEEVLKDKALLDALAEEMCMRFRDAGLGRSSGFRPTTAGTHPPSEPGTRGRSTSRPAAPARSR